MREALGLAGRGLGRTTPNPPVGCVIVNGDEVVGRGFHAKAGEEHAEAMALREAGHAALGATAYVTLEPCSHFGRTPPCADALISAGIRKVMVASLDPDSRVAGAGVRKLREAGIEVETGLLEDEALQQQSGFRSLVVRGRPWVIWKYAMSLDGRVTSPDSERRWVSGERARALTHQWRDQADGIAVGSGTVLADDPQLTTRGVPGGRSPRPVLFDRRGRIPAEAKALRSDALLVTSPHGDASAAQAAGATIVRAANLPAALSALGSHGISSLLLEGGPILAGAFYDADLIDEVRAFVAPSVYAGGLSPLAPDSRAGGSHVRELPVTSVSKVGDDVLVEGCLHSIPRLDEEAVATGALSGGVG